MKKKRQDAAFRRLVGSALVGSACLIVSDTPYELLFVSYHEEDREARWMIEAFVEEDGAWFRTDVLMGNPRFQVVRAALRSGEITARG